MSEEIKRLVSPIATFVLRLMSAFASLSSVCLHHYPRFEDRCRRNNRQVLVVPASQALFTRLRVRDNANLRAFPKKEDSRANMARRGPMPSIRELYHSSNGDRWYLARDSDTGRVFIKQEANLSSGGHIAEIEIGPSLSQGNGPQQG